MVAPSGSTKDAISRLAPSFSVHSRLIGRVPTEEALEKAEAEWQSKEQPEESEQTTGELGTEETQPEERTEPERESEPEEEAEPDGESEPKEENKPEGESEPEEETEPEGETDPEESKAEEPTEW